LAAFSAACAWARRPKRGVNSPFMPFMAGVLTGVLLAAADGPLPPGSSSAAAAAALGHRCQLIQLLIGAPGFGQLGAAAVQPLRSAQLCVPGVLRDDVHRPAALGERAGGLVCGGDWWRNLRCDLCFFISSTERALHNYIYIYMLVARTIVCPSARSDVVRAEITAPPRRAAPSVLPTRRTVASSDSRGVTLCLANCGDCGSHGSEPVWCWC
jgi:hypothetical protein